MFFSPSRQLPALTWNMVKTTSFHILTNRVSLAFVTFEMMQCEELKASFNKLRICCIWNYMREHKSSRWKISVPQPSTSRGYVSYASVIATKFVVVKQSKNTHTSANTAASVFADKVIFMLQHRLRFQAKFVKLIFHNIIQSL